MSQLSGFFFDGRSAKRRAVTVNFSEPGYITLRELGAQLRFPLDDVDVQPRISEQPAIVELPGNARLEVSDAEAFYVALKAHTGARQWQHGLESRWSAIAAAMLLTVAFGWFIYAQGIPMLAKWVAHALPDEVNQAISVGSLQAMDRNVFTPSTLKPNRRQRIRAAMQEVTRTIGGDQRYMLLFRGGGELGANALAFPSGVIVFTDDLVRVAGSTDELRTIMAHEVGHVRNQHGLRMVLQKSLLAGLAIVVTGDVSAVVGITAALPKVLLEAGYSREFEYEADAVAKEYLLATGRPLSLFADIMSRIAAKSADRPNAPNLLMTHPDTEERIKAFLD